MRILVCLFVCAAACRAQRPEDGVLAVYKQIEKAEQAGDLDAWAALWTPEAAPNVEQLRKYVQPQPDVHYTSSAVYVQGEQAALLGEVRGRNFLAMRFVKQDGRWKIKDQLWSEQPFDAASVYAMVPPPDGAFARAGSHWENAPAGLSAANAAKQGWQVRAVFDESFLYVRIETVDRLPAPGSEVEKPPSGWPVMKIAVAGQGEFVLNAGANIGDQATFDKTGRANSHRPFVDYSLRLERRGQRTIFEANAGLHTDPLILVGERFYEVRVPLRTMGVAEAGPAKIVVGDASWPKTAVFSVEAARYR